MKSIEEIEKMNLEELERIADDTGVPVPEDLKAGLDGVIDSLELVDRAVERHERRRIIYGICTAAVCLQVFIFAGLMQIRGRNAPVDTFDDDETIALTGEGQIATGSVTDSEVELSDGESA